jgi:hypothetical protein
MIVVKRVLKRRGLPGHSRIEAARKRQQWPRADGEYSVKMLRTARPSRLVAVWLRA